MIRKFKPSDIETVLDIWLKTSIEAHHFIEADFWQSQVDNMRNIYIPASETFVVEKESTIIGFYSLYKNTLAAIFVTSSSQGFGIGKTLINHAKLQRTELNLSVYKENLRSFKFYQSQGFTVISEQADEHTGHQEYTMSTVAINIKTNN